MATKKFDGYVIGSRDEDDGEINAIYADDNESVFQTASGAQQNANECLEGSDEEEAAYAVFGLTFLGYQRKKNVFTFEKA